MSTPISVSPMGQISPTLAGFLRDRRAKLDPASLGFKSSRRRTPGLRREEVAQRANISSAWYMCLEQGRGGAPSADVLNNLAKALLLKRKVKPAARQGATCERCARFKNRTNAPNSQIQKVIEQNKQQYPEMAKPDRNLNSRSY